MMSRNPVRSALAASVLLAFAASGAQANELIEKFYDSYVGSGSAQVLDTGETEESDLDVTIESFKDDGFTLKWITVVRGANGARAMM